MSLTNRALVMGSLSEGTGWIKDRIGLVVLLYSLNLGAALLLAVPVYKGFVEQVGSTGFGAELVEAFDLILWQEIVSGLVDVLSGVGWQLLWIVPAYWVWRTAAHMGTIYALHQGAIWPFWRGVGYYTGKGLLVGLAFLPAKAIWVGAAFTLAVSINGVWTGEIGAFWSWAVILPVLLLAGLGLLELFQRYARISIVVRHDAVGRAIAAGFSWPVKYGAAGYLFLIWLGVALVVLVGIQLLNAKLHVGVSAVLFGFLIQQVSLFTNAAVSIGWIGSEVSLFERTHIGELPLIADTRAIPGDAVAFEGEAETNAA